MATADRNTLEGRILVAGSLAFDFIMDFPGKFQDHILPDKLHIINLSFLVDRMRKQRGGCAGNIAYTLALLGERSRIVAAAGNDFGSYKEWLEAQGVDTAGIHVHADEMTATCMITTDKANNQITGFYKGAMARAGEISLKACAAPTTQLAIVAPDDPEAMIRHIREAREAGIPVLYDPSFQVIALLGEQLWESADGAKALIVNDYEFAVFQEKTGKTLEQMLERIELVVVTLGEQGSRIHTRDGRVVEVKAAKVKEVVDPTGAGDAYRAGFVYGLVRGEDLESCGRRGSVAAAWAIENYGTQNFHYTVDEFARRYEENYGVKPPAETVSVR